MKIKLNIYLVFFFSFL